MKPEGLKSWLCKTIKACGSAGAKLSSRQKEVRAPEARVRLPCNEVDSLKRRKLAKIDVEVMIRRVVDRQGNIIEVIMGLHRDKVDFYNSNCCGVCVTLVEFSKRLKEAFDCEAENLQQNVCDDVCGAAKKARASFENAPGATDMRLGVTVGQAASTGDSAMPRSFSSPTTTWDAVAAASCNWSSPDLIPRKEASSRALSNAPGAHDPRVRSACGARCRGSCIVVM